MSKRRYERSAAVSLSASSNGAANFAADRPPCPRCSRPMEVAHAARPRHLVGLTGEFEVVRPEYRCRPCSEHAVPADRLTGLGPSTISQKFVPIAERGRDYQGVRTKPKSSMSWWRSSSNVPVNGVFSHRPFGEAMSRR